MTDLSRKLSESVLSSHDEHADNQRELTDKERADIGMQLRDAIRNKDERTVREIFARHESMKEWSEQTSLLGRSWSNAFQFYGATALTPLQYAVRYEMSGEMAKLLVQELECDVNARGWLQTSPLHLACRYNRKPAVEMLLHNRANPLVKDYNGKRARQYTRDRDIVAAVKQAEKTYKPQQTREDWQIVVPLSASTDSPPASAPVPVGREQRPAVQRSKSSSDATAAVGPYGSSSAPLSPFRTDAGAYQYRFGDFTRAALDWLQSQHRAFKHTGNHAAQGDVEEFASMPLVEFEHLGPLTEIGKGSFGSVFKARWNHDYGHDLVAIKVLENALDLGDEETLEELKVMNTLKHRNVVKFLGVCIDYDEHDRQGRMALCMSFATGGSLYKRIHCEERAYTQHDAQRWGLDIAEGMRYLHAHDFVHRDLKSPNVLLTYLPGSNRGSMSDSETDLSPPMTRDALLTAQICDFGLAVARSNIRKQQHGSRGNGTIRWLAPECMMPGGNLTKKVDIYSFGVVMYELATRAIPFPNYENIQVVFQICAKAARPDTTRAAAGFLPTITACWAQDAKDRPDFDEALQLLKEAFIEREAYLYHGDQDEALVDSHDVTIIDPGQ